MQQPFTYRLNPNIWDSIYGPSRIIAAYQYLPQQVIPCPQGPDSETSLVASLLAPTSLPRREDVSILLIFLQQAMFLT